MTDTGKSGEPDGDDPGQPHQQGQAAAPRRSGRSGDGFDSVIPAMQEQERERHQRQLDDSR